MSRAGANGAAAGRFFLGLPAPAKINLFLHVLGRRDDGYHEIQSVFVPVDLCDTLDFRLRADACIEREGDMTGPADSDLPVRAARLLQSYAAQTGAGAGALGATITVEKRIPVGAGLGGGSSDAATTLIALNRLWALDLPRAILAELGQRLGADVTFFLGTRAAFVEGIGERCTPLTLPPAWYVVLFPQVSVSTAEIFADPKLTRNTKGTTIAGFSAALTSRAGEAGGAAADRWFGANDLEAVVRGKIRAVQEALRLLGRFRPARMSGSGSAVFCTCAGEAEAREVSAQVRAQAPPGWQVWAVPGLASLPLADW
jgi:4-diphosphocytidyl-2-C-methyl-D-erythritol kinase